MARFARLAAFAALAIVGRVAFVWAPNYALTYVVVFLAGVIDGKRTGAAVGLLGMTITNLLFSGLHPILLANAGAMALIGLIGGMLRPWLSRPADDDTERILRLTVLATTGLFATLLFSLASDLLGFVVSFVLTPEGAVIGERALVPLLLMGLAFNLGPALLNATLFAVLTPAVAESLRRAGHMRPHGA